MNEALITRYIAETFRGVNVVHPETSGGPEIARGDTFFIYDPERNLKTERCFPFATIVTKDYGDFDRASNLNRPGVFRLNIGVSKASFVALFGEAADTQHDFAALDRIMPHPIYGKMFWICVLNPSAETFEIVRPLLAEAYETVVRKHEKNSAQ